MPFKQLRLLSLVFFAIAPVMAGQDVKEYIPLPYSYELVKKAQEGDADSQCLLGLAYADGNGVEQDKKTAFLLYKKAAEQGNTWAQSKVGYYYANGISVEKDEKEACKWYEKAANAGNLRAKQKLIALQTQSTTQYSNNKETNSVFKDNEFNKGQKYRLHIEDPANEIYERDLVNVIVVNKDKDLMALKIISITLGNAYIDTKNIRDYTPSQGIDAQQIDKDVHRAERLVNKLIDKTITVQYYQIKDKSNLE